VFRGQAASR